MFLFFFRPCWALKVPLQDRLITDIIEMNKVQFDLKSYAWFQNRTGTQCKFHLKSRVWFQTKIVRHSSITALLHSFSVKAQNSVAQIQDFSVSLHKYLIDPVLSWFVKSCKSCLSFSWNLIGYFKEALKPDWLLWFSKAFSLTEKRMWLRA